MTAREGEAELAEMATTTFAIPDGWRLLNVGQCRSCHAPIAWCMTPNDRKAPVNDDGSSHFSTCPERDQWRRAVPPLAQPTAAVMADRARVEEQRSVVLDDSILAIADELADPARWRDLPLHAGARERGFLISPATRTKVAAAAAEIRRRRGE